MSREDASRTSEVQAKPKTEIFEIESAERIVASLVHLENLSSKLSDFEARSRQGLADIRETVRIPDEIAASPAAKAEAGLRAVAAEAGAEIAKTERAALGTIRVWADKHRKAAIFLLASVLAHAPALPQTRAMYDRVVEAIKGISEWEKPNMVIRPQTDAERQAVVDRMYERGARSDAAGTERYKAEMREKLENGESVSFKRMYLDMERLGGENPDEVRQAEEKLDRLIEAYAAQMNGRMDEAFIRRLVMERFGPDSDYVWGQGSLTKRMVTGKRNCTSFAREQQILFEGLIQRLPESERSRYEIGLSFEKQHQIATFTVKRADGSVEATYLLQPPVEKIANARDRAGSPTVSLETVKKAMMSKGPVRVKADGKGEKVEDSPDLDTVVDQPVSLNIKIDGKLRGSDYVRNVAERQNVKPVERPPLPPSEVGAWEISPEYLEVPHEGVEATRAIKIEGIRNKKHALDATRLVSPTPEAVSELNVGDGEVPNPLTVPQAVDFGDMSRWNREAIREALRLRFRSIGIKTAEDGTLSDAVLESLEEESALCEKSHDGKPKTRYLVVKNVNPERKDKLEARMPVAQLEKFLHAARAFDEISLGYYTIDEPEAEVLAKAPQKEFALRGRNLSARTIEILGRSKKQIFIESHMYMENVKDHPEIVKYDNIDTNMLYAIENDPNSAFVYLSALERYYPPNHNKIQDFKRLMRRANILPRDDQVNEG